MVNLLHDLIRPLRSAWSAVEFGVFCTSMFDVVLLGIYIAALLSRNGGFQKRL